MELRSDPLGSTRDWSDQAIRSALLEKLRPGVVWTGRAGIHPSSVEIRVLVTELEPDGSRVILLFENAESGKSLSAWFEGLVSSDGRELKTWPVRLTRKKGPPRDEPGIFGNQARSRAVFLRSDGGEGLIGWCDEQWIELLPTEERVAVASEAQEPEGIAEPEPQRSPAFREIVDVLTSLDKTQAKAYRMDRLGKNDYDISLKDIAVDPESGRVTGRIRWSTLSVSQRAPKGINQWKDFEGRIADVAGGVTVSIQEGVPRRYRSYGGIEYTNLVLAENSQGRRVLRGKFRYLGRGDFAGDVEIWLE